MNNSQIISGNIRDQVGECPVWSVAEQVLYWVDIAQGLIRRWSPTSNTVDTWIAPEQVGSIALSSKSGLIVAMETGIFEIHLLNPPTLELNLLAKFDHPHLEMRANDGRCDPFGRFWVGTMRKDMALASNAGGFFCLDEDGLDLRIPGMITPNGLAFSTDGKKAYFSDSHPNVQTIWVCDYDEFDAKIQNIKVFSNMQDLPGRPDGAAMDSEGCYWIAANDAGLIHRFSPSGDIISSLKVPVLKPSMCAFGGPSLDMLFVTSIIPAGIPSNEIGLNGALFAFKPGVKGLAEPVFSKFPVNRSVIH